MSFVLTYNSLIEKTINYLEKNDENVAGDIDAWIKFAHERIARDSNTQLFEVYVGGTFTPGVSVYPKPARWQNTITWNFGSGGTTLQLGNNPLNTNVGDGEIFVTVPSASNLTVGQTVIISGASNPGGELGGVTDDQINITSSIYSTIIDPLGQAFSYLTEGTATSYEIGGGSNVTVTFPTYNDYTPILLRPYEYARSFWPNQKLTAPPQFYADFAYYNWLISPTPDQAYPYLLSYLETPQVIDASYQTNYLTEFMPEVLLKAVLLEAMLDLQNDLRIPIIEQEYVKAISSWNAKNDLRKVDRYTTLEAD